MLKMFINWTSGWLVDLRELHSLVKHQDEREKVVTLGKTIVSESGLAHFTWLSKWHMEAWIVLTGNHFILFRSKVFYSFTREPTKIILVYSAMKWWKFTLFPISFLFKVKQKNPSLFVDGVSRFDICQGRVGRIQILFSVSGVTGQHLKRRYLLFTVMSYQHLFINCNAIWSRQTLLWSYWLLHYF